MAETIPLHSELRSVHDFDSLLRSFVQSLPSKVAAIRTAMETDPGAAAALLHKLQGSAGGYGYPSISRAVSELEKKVKSGVSAPELAGDVEGLEVLVERALRGLDPAPNV